MRDWDCIGCPNEQLGRQGREALQRMALGELDAGKPPVQFDEGQSRDMKLTNSVG